MLLLSLPHLFTLYLSISPIWGWYCGRASFAPVPASPPLSPFLISHLLLRRRECCGASIICSGRPPPTITNALFFSDLIDYSRHFSALVESGTRNKFVPARRFADGTAIVTGPASHSFRPTWKISPTNLTGMKRLQRLLRLLSKRMGNLSTTTSSPPHINTILALMKPPRCVKPSSCTTASPTAPVSLPLVINRRSAKSNFSPSAPCHWMKFKAGND